MTHFCENKNHEILINKLESENQELRKEVKDLRNKLEKEIQKKQTKTDKHIRSLEEENDKQQRKIKSLQEQVDDLTQENNELKSEIDNLNIKIDAINSKLDFKITKKISSNAIIQNLQNNVDILQSKMKIFENDANKQINLEVGEIISLYKWCVAYEIFGEKKCRYIRADMSNLRPEDYELVYEKIILNLEKPNNKEEVEKYIKDMLLKRHNVAHYKNQDLSINDFKEKLKKFCILNNLEICSSISEKMVKYIETTLKCEKPFEKQNKIIRI